MSITNVIFVTLAFIGINNAYNVTNFTDKQCGQYVSIALDNDLYYQSDVWNANALGNGWYECIYTYGDTTQVQYTLWPSQYGDNSVKSYPSIVAGWNFGSGYRYGYGTNGLPFDVTDSTKVVNTSWSITHENWNDNGNGFEAYDISYDLWLDNNPNLDKNATPQLEFMVFLKAVNTAYVYIHIYSLYLYYSDTVY